MKLSTFALLLAALTLLLTVSCVTYAAPVDDEQIISDRPSDADNPKTMDHGQFRIEAGVYSFTHDVAGGVRTTKQTYGNVYLVGGLGHDSELQVAYDGFTQLQLTDGDGIHVNRASGGEKVRYKWNLVGNREGRFALALLPRLQKTEGLDGEQWQGALAIPLSYDITEKLQVGLNPEWRIETNDQTNHRAHGAYNAIVLDYSINNLWDVFGQNSEHTQHIRDGWAVTAGFGLSYKASKKLQLDVGTDFGLTGPADNFNLQAGFTYVL